jgi:hypothetical protein
MRLTTLPDDPAVGEHYFAHPLRMTSIEMRFCRRRLHQRVALVHSTLAAAWTSLLVRLAAN